MKYKLLLPAVLTVLLATPAMAERVDFDQAHLKDFRTLVHTYEDYETFIVPDRYGIPAEKRGHRTVWVYLDESGNRVESDFEIPGIIDQRPFLEKFKQEHPKICKIVLVTRAVAIFAAPFKALF